MTGRRFRILVALTVVSGFLGGAVSNLLLRGTPAAAQMGGDVQDVVKAKRFEVVDDKGKRRAVLSTSADGRVGLWLNDDAGNVGTALFVTAKGGPGLGMNDTTGKMRLGLAVLPDGTASALTLLDDAGQSRAILTVLAKGPSGLALYDATGKRRAGLTVPADGKTE